MNNHTPNKPMKNLLLTTTLTLGMAAASLAVEIVPGRVLVKPSAQANENSMRASLNAAGAREIARIPQLDVRILEVPEAAEERVVAALTNESPRAGGH